MHSSRPRSKAVPLGLYRFYLFRNWRIRILYLSVGSLTIFWFKEYFLFFRFFTPFQYGVRDIPVEETKEQEQEQPADKSNSGVGTNEFEGILKCVETLGSIRKKVEENAMQESVAPSTKESNQEENAQKADFSQRRQLGEYHD